MPFTCCLLCFQSSRTHRYDHPLWRCITLSDYLIDQCETSFWQTLQHFWLLDLNSLCKIAMGLWCSVICLKTKICAYFTWGNMSLIWGSNLDFIVTFRGCLDLQSSYFHFCRWLAVIKTFNISLKNKVWLTWSKEFIVWERGDLQ